MKFAFLFDEANFFRKYSILFQEPIFSNGTVPPNLLMLVRKSDINLKPVKFLGS